MFDALTRDELYALHHELYMEGSAIHNRIQALPATAFDAQLLFMAKHREISETMRAVYAEIDRRDV